MVSDGLSEYRYTHLMDHYTFDGRRGAMAAPLTDGAMSVTEPSRFSDETAKSPVLALT